MIKVFDAGNLPSDSGGLENAVNAFLKRLKCDYTLHVTARPGYNSGYTVIVVEYNP